MKRAAWVLGSALCFSGCATFDSGPSPFREPAAFEGQEISLCGSYRHGGLYSARSTDTDFEVRGAPDAFGHTTNWGRKCLTGIVKRTGYDPSDPDIICLDYCRVWALDVGATPPRGTL